MRLMAKMTRYSTEDFPARNGPYDGAAEAPWFLPDDGSGGGDSLPPLPRADRRRLIDPDEWAAAQAALVVELADLAWAYGRLEERLLARSARAILHKGGGALSDLVDALCRKAAPLSRITGGGDQEVPA